MNPCFTAEVLSKSTYVKTGANQWLLSEYDDPNVTLSLNTFEAQIKIIALYEDIDIDAL